MSILDGENPVLSFDPEKINACYFRVSQDSRIYNGSGGSVSVPDEFYNFILMGYREDHGESMSMKNVISDTYCAFATGANPISVSVQGVLPMALEADRRLDFHYLYNNYFRGAKLQKQKLILQLYIKSTFYVLYILSLNMSITSDTQDICQFSLSGIGANYQILSA